MQSLKIENIHISNPWYACNTYIYRKVFHFSKIPESPPLSKHALPRPLKSNKAFMWFNLNSKSPLFSVLCCLVGMCQIKWAIFKDILCLILKLIFLWQKITFIIGQEIAKENLFDSNHIIFGTVSLQ